MKWVVRRKSAKKQTIWSATEGHLRNAHSGTTLERYIVQRENEEKRNPEKDDAWRDSSWIGSCPKSAKFVNLFVISLVNVLTKECV